jgi:hypothetical protein
MLSRVPRWGDITVQCDFRNNVIYDWGFYCGYGDLRSLNYVNNFLRKGASTTQNPPLFVLDPKVILAGSLFVNGNIMDEFPEVTRDNWKGVSADRSFESHRPFAAPPVQTQSAEAAFDLVLNNAGATLPRRDSVDLRDVSDVRHHTGQIINNENQVGGWPVYASGEPPADSTHDGIPDEWKKSHGLSVSDPGLGKSVNADGYTELEVYLNSLTTK